MYGEWEGQIPNVGRSEGLNVKKKERVGRSGKQSSGEDGARQTQKRIAHLNGDVKCFAANGRK